MIVVLVTLIATAGLLLTACGSDNSPARGTKSSDTSTSAPAATTAQPPTLLKPDPVRWNPCGDGFQCGSVDVPVDYAHPGGAKLTVPVIRQLATGPEPRVGAVVFNPGGPGLAGVPFLRQVKGILPGPMQHNFDLVSFDPRGTGGTGQLECSDGAVPLATIAEHRKIAAACRAKYRDLIDHVDTMSTARDLEMIRIAIGEPTLNYLGSSYGTELGVAYRSQFPEHIRAMVLDGDMDVAAPLEQRAPDQAKAAQGSVTRLLASCAGVTPCPLGTDPVAKYDALIDQLDATPLTLPGGAPPVDLAELQTAAVFGAYNAASAPGAISALAAAANGDGTPTRSFMNNQFFGANGTRDTYWTTTCNDVATPTSESRLEALDRKLQAQYPRVGRSAIARIAGCAARPPGPEPVTIDTTTPTAPIMLIGSTGDPATPFVWTRHLADALGPPTKVLTRTGDGHTAIFGAIGDPCVATAISNYFTDPHAPLTTSACPAPS